MIQDEHCRADWTCLLGNFQFRKSMVILFFPHFGEKTTSLVSEVVEPASNMSTSWHKMSSDFYTSFFLWKILLFLFGFLISW